MVFTVLVIAFVCILISSCKLNVSTYNEDYLSYISTKVMRGGGQRF